MKAIECLSFLVTLLNAAASGIGDYSSKLMYKIAGLVIQWIVWENWESIERRNWYSEVPENK
jgi:hypothetical protein